MSDENADLGDEVIANLRQALAEAIADENIRLSRDHDIDMDACMRGRVDALNGVLLYMIPIAQMKAWEKR